MKKLGWMLPCMAALISAVAIAEEKPAVKSTVDVDFYGYIRMDGIYETDPGTFLGNVAFWANKKDAFSKSQFNLTANQSRLGWNFAAPKLGDTDLTAKLELDFYSFQNAENKALPMMRQAFLKSTWKDLDFSLLFGQTWDIISPLVPTTLNFLAMGDSGNMGYRRVQLQAYKGIGIADKTKFAIQLGIARTVGNDAAGPGVVNYATSLPAVNSANDAGYPMVQGRLSFAMPLLTDEVAAIGVSAHMGRERYLVAAAGSTPAVDKGTFASNSLNVDLHLPLIAGITIDGEYFTGKNLGAYFGGIGQGINTALWTEYRATGGWAQLSLPVDKLKFNLGAGMDKVKDEDLSVGNKQKNTTYYANMLYTFSKSWNCGLEYARVATQYYGQSTPFANRVQTAIAFNF